MDGSTSIGNATLDNAGNAGLSISALAAGPHNVSAAYAGDANFTVRTSPATAQLVQELRFFVPSGGGSASIRHGEVATYQLQLGLSDGTTFPSAVTLSLAGVPAGATYSTTPTTIAAGSAWQNVIIRVQTPQLTSTARPNTVNTGRMLAVIGFPLVSIFYLRIDMLARRKRICIALLFLVIALVGMTACGTGGTLLSKSEVYTLQLNATSRSLDRSTNLTLIVHR